MKTPLDKKIEVFYAEGQLNRKVIPVEDVRQAIKNILESIDELHPEEYDKDGNDTSEWEEQWSFGLNRKIKEIIKQEVGTLADDNSPQDLSIGINDKTLGFTSDSRRNSVIDTEHKTEDITKKGEGK